MLIYIYIYTLQKVKKKIEGKNAIKKDTFVPYTNV